MALADWAKENTATGAVFLATDRPNNPVATLGGRSVVLGYRGWLYNFSVPYGERVATAQAALAGRVDDPAVRRYDPDYLLVAADEGAGWTVASDELARMPVAYLNSSWTVYALRR